MRTATFTQTNNVVAGYTKMSFAAFVIMGSVFFSGCSNDESSPIAANFNEKETASEKVAMPKTFSEEPTIEITGKASFDIVSLNEKIAAEYNFTADPGRNALLKTGAELIVENMFDADFAYKDIAEKILSKGEDWLDDFIDGFTFGQWSNVKKGLLGWLFPEEKKEEFDVKAAFDKVNAQLANIEAILTVMRSEVENGMKEQTYAQRLTDRRDLYSVLKNGLEELQNKIISINNDNKKYPTDEDKFDAVKAAVRQWGEESVGTASAVMPARQQAKNLIEKITNSVQIPGKTGYVSDYLSIYDEYARRTLMWEQEGYAWRELMRAQDAKMVMQLSIASLLYYTLVNENQVEIENLYKKIAAYRELVKNTPIVRHSTPIYIKYGSKWAGQVFTGELKTMNYAKILKDKKWSKGENQMLGKSNKYIKYILKEETYRYNDSRLYGGYAPAQPASNEKMNVYAPATQFAMPEEWFREVFNGYVVGGKHKTLMEIFKSIGFRYNSKELQIRDFETDKFEQYFITNNRPYTKVYYVSDHVYHLAIPVVTGNSTDIMKGIVGKLEDVNDHNAIALKYQATNTYSVTRTGKNSRSTDKTDTYRMYYKLLTDYSSYRTMFYLAKADKAVEVK